LKISEVAELLRCSVPTVRRWLAEARRGERLFPLPLNQPRSQNLWRREDIENWTENPAKSPSKSMHQKKVQRRSEIAGLARHNINVD